MTLQNLEAFGTSSRVGKRSFWALGLGVALMAALPGCVAHAEGGLVADYPVDYVETAPPRIESYPQTYYRGSPAYLVDGRWYYRTHDRWTVFREEPVELREYRVRRSPAYLGPSDRSYGRDQERLVAQRRVDDRRVEQQRNDARRAEQQREAERRAEEDRRRGREQAQRGEQRRHAEQVAEAQRADQQRVEQQREAERRAAADRVAQRRGQATRKRDRSQGDQHDPRDERDQRHVRQD